MCWVTRALCFLHPNTVHTRGQDTLTSNFCWFKNSLSSTASYMQGPYKFRVTIVLRFFGCIFSCFSLPILFMRKERIWPVSKSSCAEQQICCTWPGVLGVKDSERGKHLVRQSSLITGPNASVPQSRQTFASASGFPLQMEKFRWDIETGESLDTIISNWGYW